MMTGHMGRGRRKRCMLCAEGLDEVDYKRVSMLRRYITERATILPRRRTGTCARHQRKLATAIKRARTMALLPIGPTSHS